MLRTPEPLLNLTEVPPRTSKALVGLVVPIPTLPFSKYTELPFRAQFVAWGLEMVSATF